MSSGSKVSHRPWFERAVIAAMVIAGFAIGSVALTALAEFGDDEPVLTDEFNAPIADDTGPGDAGVEGTDADPVPEVITTIPDIVDEAPADDATADDGTADDDLDGNDERERDHRPRPERERETRRRA